MNCDDDGGSDDCDDENVDGRVGNHTLFPTLLV